MMKKKKVSKSLSNNVDSQNKGNSIKKESVFKCTYADCGKSYSSIHHLRRHEAIHSGTLKCTEKNCEKFLKTKASLKKHIDIVHLKKNPKKYKCPDCNEEFNKHSWLTRHQFRHTGILPYVCPNEDCEKRFLLPSKLKRHMKIHEGYTCTKENCGKKFPKWSLYRTHLKLSHPRIHKCHYCDKEFSRSNNLKDHMKFHELDREVFSCPKPNCSRFYLKKNSLNSHIKSYHEQRPFVCTVEHCHRAFKSETDMMAHSSRHYSKCIRKKKRKSNPKASFAAQLAGLAPKNWQIESETEQEIKSQEISEDYTSESEESEDGPEFIGIEQILSQQPVQDTLNLTSDNNKNKETLADYTSESEKSDDESNTTKKNYDTYSDIQDLINMTNERDKCNSEISVTKTKCISLKA